MLSRIVKSYIEWEHIAPRIGIIPVQKEALKEFFDSAKDEELTKAAIRSADRFMDQLIVLAGKSTLDSFLYVTKLRVQKSGFSIIEFVNGSNRKLLIHHGVNRKWSLYFSEYHKRIINNLGYSAETEVKDNFWVIQIQTSGKKMNIKRAVAE